MAIKFFRLLDLLRKEKFYRTREESDEEFFGRTREEYNEEFFSSPLVVYANDIRKFLEIELYSGSIILYKMHFQIKQKKHKTSDFDDLMYFLETTESSYPERLNSEIELYVKQANVLLPLKFVLFDDKKGYDRPHFEVDKLGFYLGLPSNY